MGRKIGNYRSTNKCSRLVTDNQRGLHLFCDIVFAVKARLSYLMVAFYAELCRHFLSKNHFHCRLPNMCCGHTHCVRALNAGTQFL